MKIAILADPVDVQYAGIYRYTDALIRAWLRLYPQHEWVLVKRRKTDDYAGAQQLIVPLASQNPFSTALRLFWRIPQALRRLQPDIVIEPAHFGPFNLPPEIRRVTVIHDLTPLLFPQFHPLRGRLPQQLLLPHILRNTDHIISNSDYTLSDLHRHFPFTKGKSTAAPLGIEKTYQPTHDTTVLAKYGIHAPYILYLGTIEPRKNLKLLLQAYQLLRERSSLTPQLVIAGKHGWKTQAFDRALEAHPFRSDIHLVGYVEEIDKPALYSQAAAFAYPSLYEGFGLPLLEAMACGAACVTTSVSSLPEVGGEAVLYTQPDDAQSLADHLRKVLSDEAFRQQLGQKARRRASQFSWDETARVFMEVLKM